MSSLFPRHPSTRREVSKQAAKALRHAKRQVDAIGALDADAFGVRKAFASKRRDGQDDETRQRRASKDLLVKGRLDQQSGRILWDVFRLDRQGRTRFEIGGFAWQEEAIAKARDLLLGRVSVSFGGARACFRAPGRGRLLSPLKNIDQAGEAEVKVRQVPGGVVVTR